MNLYNPSGVKAGVAGVMNTFFLRVKHMLIGEF